MPTSDDVIRPLLEALQVTPDNLPLRLHVAQLMLNHGRFEQAAEHFRQALERDSDHAPAKLGLAEAYMQLGKGSTAIVIIEELLSQPRPPAGAYLLHARLLIGSGQVERAAEQYRRAIDANPQLADATLAEQVGHNAYAERNDDTDDNPYAGANDFDGRLPADPDGPMGQRPDYEIERPKIKFADVGGMEPLKEEIRIKIIAPLEHPELFEAYGKAIGGGILMYGPPGCGKTHLARATAGQVNANFINVGIHQVLDMWIGNSEKNLHELFEYARRNTPCVLFFDEVDALGANRSDMRGSAGRTAINQFLAELDGAERNNDGLLVLGATNAPWHLDPAFRRPGRFDRVLFVPPPDDVARAEIVRVMLAGKPIETIDFDLLARKTEGHSGADLKAMIDLAIEAKLREAMSKGAPSPLTTKDLQRAAKQIKPTVSEWFATAKNYAVYANESGAYDDILKYINRR